MTLYSKQKRDEWHNRNRKKKKDIKKEVYMQEKKRHFFKSRSPASGRRCSGETT